MSKKMTLAEKLRFLADRAEDGQEFCLRGITIKFDSIGNMVFENQNGEWIYSDIKLNTIDYLDINIKPQWEFTEDEKAILRNLPDEFRWIARDKSVNQLYVYNSKPTKENQIWLHSIGSSINFNIFPHLFKSIQWSDEEPCAFRRYI